MSAETPFKDHFSGHAGAYARFRPDYPPELFSWLARVAPGRAHAWDCATGSGQCARGLAAHFGSVMATDASAEQVRSADPFPGVTFRVATAERSGLSAASMDVVTVAQALHWFDLPRFFAEAARVLRPGGVLAAWCYGLMSISPEVDRVTSRLYHEVVGPFWPPERSMVEDAYRSVALPVPFTPIPAPRFAMRAEWTLDDVSGYLGTWSAVQRHDRATGRDAVAAVADALAAAWGGADQRRTVRWMLHPRVGRKAGA